MGSTDSGLFNDNLRNRHAASAAAPQELRDEVARGVMSKARMPRLGTSGAANAFIVMVGSEFGMSGKRRVYSPAAMGKAGWQSLWRLRVGEPNAHFDPRWTEFRLATTLWSRLYTWLPVAVGDEQLALSMFAWANLSVTSGNSELGTPASHARGMDAHVAPFIEASGARVVVATSDPTREQIDRWARGLGADASSVGDMAVWHVRVGERDVVAAKVGHPSRGVSRADFIRRLSALIEATGQRMARSASPPVEIVRSSRRYGPPLTPERGVSVSQEGTLWHPDQVFEFAVAKWQALGGTAEPRWNGQYYKLVHPSTRTEGACVVIDLERGTFDHFTNVRITTLGRWHEIFGEVADAFVAYFPPDRGITSTGRSNRIECELRQVHNWRNRVDRFLELCRDYWIRGGTLSKPDLGSNTSELESRL